MGLALCKTESVQPHQPMTSDYMALVDFLKNQDVESLVNSLFVLVESKNPEESLPSLMTRLRVSKTELI